MNHQENISIELIGVGKKFCSDIQKNLWYCFKDILKRQFGLNTRQEELRDKEFWALEDVSFELRKGEITAIVGMNGSGKTTLSRIISGIFQPDKGTINHSGKLRITPLFTLNAGLHPLFSGRENIYIKAAAFGMQKDEIENSIEDIIAFSELDTFIDSPVGNYSSGMKARLSYSIAMATQPDVFVIDEALAVGDIVFKAKCLEHIKSIVKEKKRSVLYVTNHVDKVLEMADRLLILDKGKLLRETIDIKSGLQFFIDYCLGNETDDRRNALKDLIENWGLDD